MKNVNNDTSLKSKLESNKFIVTAELCPPKGSDSTLLVEKARIIKPYVDAINITDNQRAIMRFSALAAAHLVKREEIDVILQMTCRDRNRIALQSDLLGAYGLGIRNVLALTGDYVTEGDHVEAKPVFDLDSTQLIKTISLLNQGYNLSGRAFKNNTDYFIGAAVNPCTDPQEPQRISFERKIEAGASFFQTQAIFDIEQFSKFMDYAKSFPVKIIAGILLVKSAKMAKFLNDSVPGIKIHKEILKKIEDSKDPLKTGIEIAREQVKELRKICHGVHIMTIGHEELILDILE